MLPTADTQHTAVYQRGNKRKGWGTLDCGNRDESIGLRSRSTVYRTESASWVSMAVPKEKEETVREDKKPKMSRLKRKRQEEETIFCICTLRAAAWFSRGFVLPLKAFV